jgi:hypothetical protein
MVCWLRSERRKEKSEVIKCEEMLMQTTRSHLSTLISQVKSDEESLGYVYKERLISMAEYILSYPRKYYKAEYDEAIKVLAKYHLAHLAERRHGWKFITAELAKVYVARCKRCGRPISSKVSLATGYGHVCRRKLGKGTNNGVAKTM